MVAMRILVGLVLLLSLTGCPEKEEYPVIVPIGFLPSVTIKPANRTMQRGDTLWLEAEFSDSLLDKNSGRRYRVRQEDLALSSGVIYKELLGVSQLPIGIAPTFRLVEKIGKAQVQGSFSSTFEPVYDGHYYRAKIGLIPTRACVASISMLVSFLFPADGTKAQERFIPFIKLAPDAQGREQKAVLDDSFYVINDGKANNFDLYSQHVRAYALEPGTPDEPIIYETKSTFTVEVK